MRNILSRFAADDNGATAIEYGLIAAIIGLGIVVSLGTVRGALSTLFTNIGTNLN
jgi:pilus assembly protein Flp/PilA